MEQLFVNTRGDVILVFTAIVLASARVFACLLFFPVFSTSQISRVIKVPIAFGLSLPAINFLIADLRAMPQADYAFLMLLVMKEFVIGSSIGLLAGIPFWSAQAAGDIVDIYRGASAANFTDPVNAAETSVTGILFLRISLALFVVGGGVHSMIQVYYESFRVWAIMSLIPLEDFPPHSSISTLFDYIFKISLLIGGPLLTIMLIADFIVIFVSRGGKHISLFDLGFIFKNLILIALLPIYINYFIYYLNTEINQILRLFLKMTGIN